VELFSGFAGSDPILAGCGSGFWPVRKFQNRRKMFGRFAGFSYPENTTSRGTTATVLACRAGWAENLTALENRGPAEPLIDISVSLLHYSSTRYPCIRQSDAGAKNMTPYFLLIANLKNLFPHHIGIKTFFLRLMPAFV
jgi:hypothetical protein